jgi:hypothetical protein
MQDLSDEGEAMLWKKDGHSVAVSSMIVFPFNSFIIIALSYVQCAGHSQCSAVHFRSHYCFTEIMEGFQMD